MRIRIALCSFTKKS